MTEYLGWLALTFLVLVPVALGLGGILLGALGAWRRWSERPSVRLARKRRRAAKHWRRRGQYRR